MIQPPSTSDDDTELRAFLRRNDPITSSSQAEIAALEDRILAQIDTFPHDPLIADIPSPWILSKKWAARGAWAASVLFIVLGFIAGRSFDDLTFQSADQETLYASADSTLWQSFITAPSSSGETDDSSE
jgi:hypothetical protein